MRPMQAFAGARAARGPGTGRGGRTHAPTGCPSASERIFAAQGALQRRRSEIAASAGLPPPATAAAAAAHAAAAARLCAQAQQPNEGHTIYVNNLHEKIKQDGAPPACLARRRSDMPLCGTLLLRS